MYLHLNVDSSYWSWIVSPIMLIHPRHRHHRSQNHHNTLALLHLQLYRSCVETLWSCYPPYPPSVPHDDGFLLSLLLLPLQLMMMRAMLALPLLCQQPPHGLVPVGLLQLIPARSHNGDDDDDNGRVREDP